jgi:hypothetical protein
MHAGSKDLDFQAYHSRYVALELLYLGGSYQGFATQLDSEETIEVRQAAGNLLLSCSAVHDASCLPLALRRASGQKLTPPPGAKYNFGTQPGQRCQRQHAPAGAQRAASLYHGCWLEQEPPSPHSDSVLPLSIRAVQGYLFRALRKTRLIRPEASWQDLKYSRGGRTDKGVSALGQVRAPALPVAASLSRTALLAWRPSPLLPLPCGACSLSQPRFWWCQEEIHTGQALASSSFLGSPVLFLRNFPRPSPCYVC